MKVSVVVTTYNRPDALALVLRSLLVQRTPPFEVLVADDGSGDLTQQTIRTIAKTAKVPIHHLWQVDDGFRAAAARNLAIAAAHGDLVIFLDGDCVTRPDFVAQHVHLSQPGWFVAGSRVLLTQHFTAQVLGDQSPIHLWSRWAWLQQRLKGQTNRWWPLFNLPGQSWRRRKPGQWRRARTCNMSVWRNDLESVNGFDESYQGWGHEDADLAIRLIRHGVGYKNGRYATTVLHLWHAENDRSQLPENVARLKRIQAGDYTQAPIGLSQYTQQVVQQARRG